jgi:hypothetical protein
LIHNIFKENRDKKAKITQGSLDLVKEGKKGCLKALMHSDVCVKDK